jgi:DNA-binding GntR family transcriptional regulator
MSVPATPSYQTKREVALHLMRDAIVRGALSPGTRLVLEELSQQFELSMTPIREALPILEAEGYITQVPHRGAVVAQMDRDEIMELYTIRSAIEAMAARHAVPALSEDDLKTMERLVDRMNAADGSWEDFLSMDKEFHLVLYRASGSARWVATIENFWRRCSRYMLASTVMSGAVNMIETDHRDLLTACRDGEVERAAKLTVEHLRHSEVRLLQEWA